MKYLFLIFFVLNCSSNSKLIDKRRHLVVILSNDPDGHPVLIGKETFWAHKEFLDTIEVHSDRLYNFFTEKIDKLKKEDVEYNFSVKAAVILNRANKTDTLYSDGFFKNWYINGKNFTDSKKELGKMFGGFFLFQYDN